MKYEALRDGAVHYGEWCDCCLENTGLHVFATHKGKREDTDLMFFCSECAEADHGEYLWR